MPEFYELSYDELNKRTKTCAFNFESTSELEPLDGIIGQERAVRAMEFGLKVEMKGYNIYMSGLTGTGKTSYAESCIKKIASGRDIPDDWCYLYNFDNPNQPVAVNLPAGKGKVFQKDMEEFVKILEQEIKRAFDSEDYDKEKTEIVKEYQKKRDELLEELNTDAEKHGFKVKATASGVYFMPIVDGKSLSPEEFNELDEELKSEINRKSEELQLETVDFIRKVKAIEKETREKLEQWQNKTALFAVGAHINDLREKYGEYPKIVYYLEKVQQDILDNLDEFTGDDSDEKQKVPLIVRRGDAHTDAYKVNLIVDNSQLEGAPVIVHFNPTYHNLIGKMEYESELGTAVTDYTMIKGGLFHSANGGYLVLQAKDVLNNVQSWEALKRVLKTKEISIENLRDLAGISVSALKPEPIPAGVKVVLIGNEMIYQLLLEYDEDFRKLFKIKVDFDAEMQRNEENCIKMARFISAFCKRENTLHFDSTGVMRVIEYSSRMVEDRGKLTTRFNDIAEILAESCVWAQAEGSALVSGSHVQKAISEKRHRSAKYDDRLLELLKNGTIMIDTHGAVVGQVNGLSVIDMGDYAFGKPSRITANTYIGKSGIVNIEREVEMSGTSHSKGVLILSGYIGQKYARDMPLSLTASLCFEQLYSGVDGDSASSAELYAILSSLSELPIKQSIAVTGSVNQKGEIQPIGGATLKIEGFFELCRQRGLDGSHGVIIPYQNIENLVLSSEVADAVKSGKFHIYPVKTIDDGIEILTGAKAGRKTVSGGFEKGSVHRLVYDRLKGFLRKEIDLKQTSAK